MEMNDTTPNYNACNDELCEVTRQPVCNCVILFPIGCYSTGSLLIKNKTSVKIRAKVNNGIKWIKPKGWKRFYGDHLVLNELTTQNNEVIEFDENILPNYLCEYYLCPCGICPL